jgi:hypothetical protein
VYAIHAMFVQVDEKGTILLPALPSAVPDAHFERVLASHGVCLSGQVKGGTLASLTAETDRAMAWSFRIPQHLAATAHFAPQATVSRPDALGLVPVKCTLQAGNTHLV